jgi:hypothetical protein
VGLWDARPTTALSDARILKGALINNLGDPQNHFAVPGDPAHSMVLHRLAGNGVQRMPPLGTNEVDTADMELMTEWIKQLPR